MLAPTPRACALPGDDIDAILKFNSAGKGRQMGSFSIWHWLIVLAIVMLVFGTKRIGNMGGDLGKAIKGFKEGVNGDEQKAVK